MIVSGPTKRSTIQPLCQRAQELEIPVLFTHSVGFCVTFSLQLPAEFPIVETHPDPESTQDLRLLNPWLELSNAAASLGDLTAMDNHLHGHVPYILLLLRFVEQWKQTHGGNAPSNYKEKTEFREFVRSNARTDNAEGGEENFDEAVAAVLKTVAPFELRSSIREIFEMPQCQQLNSGSADFWIIASAIRAFHITHGVLPLPGSLPDMKAQSADYVALQNIYKSKARKDIEEVTATIRQIEAQLGRTTPILDREVEVFCKNAAHIKVVRGRPIPQISETCDAALLKSVRNGLQMPESLASTFLAFQIMDAVVDEIQTNPDLQNSCSVDDDALWGAHRSRILTLLMRDDPTPLDEDVLENIDSAIQEVRRAEGGELHNIASLAGGLVAQESLKVLTRQYVPLDNTCVFDGARSRTEMYRF